MQEKKKHTQNNDGYLVENAKYVFRLFVTGASPNSARAISNLKELCERYLQGRYSLEIIDVHQQLSLARSEQLIALPMLLKKFPLPERRFVGDLSDTQKVLNGLGLKG